MPRKYQRNITVVCSRGQWSEDDLKEAVRRLDAGEIGVNEASRYYNIPKRTLCRRRKSGNLEKLSLGPQACLGIENEKRLVRHIQSLEKCGFAPDRKTVRCLAYQFAEKLGIKHRFNKETQCAGYDWLVSFLERNKELTIRQSEGLSVARGQGMSREEVKQFFDLLLEVYTEHDFLNKPGNIYNMDESGLQLNNKPGKVIATKGTKDVHVVTSAEKGENVTVIACCNAEGTFLPPVLIMKGKRQKPEFSDGLPPGSKVYMNQQSSYINSELFFTWLKEHFLPRKSPGKVLLILDGHASHCNALNMLEFAEANNIKLLCLPSHTTQALQPLDRAFFKPLKDHFKQVTQNWILHHAQRKITRLQAGQLIGQAWIKATSVQTGISGFKATGIYPYDPQAIPDHFFAISDISQSANELDELVEPNLEPTQFEGTVTVPVEPVPGPSAVPKRHGGSTNVVSPSKYLMEIRPLPKIPILGNIKRKQSAQLLTTPERIQDKRSELLEKVDSSSTKLRPEEMEVNELKVKNKQNMPKRNTEKENVLPGGRTKKQNMIESRTRKENVRAKGKSYKKLNKKTRQSSRDESDLEKSSHSMSDYEDYCVECLEKYRETKQKVDWVQCLECEEWMHETCTIYGDKCNTCGNQKKTYQSC